jgi:hypothetical protein
VAVERKLESPVALFAAIEAKQHESLREIAFREKRSLADLVREALDGLIRSRAKKHKAERA